MIIMNHQESKSLNLVKELLGKEVNIVIDRPIGTKHPKYEFIYEVNYGYIDGVEAPDGEYLDAYYLGTDKPLKEAKGVAKAILHRLDDDDDKLIVMPKEIDIENDEIERLIAFQEKWFKHKIIKK
jgi:inorganic pyrophosphatase